MNLTLMSQAGLVQSITPSSNATYWLPDDRQLDRLRTLVRSLRAKDEKLADATLAECQEVDTAFGHVAHLVVAAFLRPETTYTVGVFNAYRITLVGQPDRELDHTAIGRELARVNIGLQGLKCGRSIVAGERFGSSPSDVYAEMCKFVLQRVVPHTTLIEFGFVGWFAYETNPQRHQPPRKPKLLGADGPALVGFTAKGDLVTRN